MTSPARRGRILTEQEQREAWTGSLEALVVWAFDRGYHVEFVKNGDDCICHISKTIEINSSNPLENQVMYLLHECGHALIFDNGGFLDFAYVRDKENAGTSKFKVYRLAEEIEAWKRGFNLANRLKIPLNDEKWDRAVVRAIKKYINWAAD